MVTSVVYFLSGPLAERMLELVEEWIPCYGAASKVISYGHCRHLARDVFLVLPGAVPRRIRQCCVVALPLLTAPGLPVLVVAATATKPKKRAATASSSATSVVESEPVLFGPSRSRWEGPAPAPPEIKQTKFCRIFSLFASTLIKCLLKN